MKTRTLFFFLCCFLIIIGIPRLLSLDAHWSSDEDLWLWRSEEFIRTVQNGQFENTLIAYHPGVTTMWIGGIRQFVFGSTRWSPLKDLALARLLIGIVVLAGLGTATFLVYRLFGTWISAASGAFLVVNPLLLAHTRRIHTDALATTFILLTVLLFLLYCVRTTEKQSWRRSCYIIFSGVAFGFACLSKSSSLILLPWMPICLWIFRDRNTPWRKFLYNTSVTLIFFLSWSLLTVFAFWPIFWNPISLLLATCLLVTTLLSHRAVHTGKNGFRYIVSTTLVLSVCASYTVKTIWVVLDRVGWAVTTAHDLEHFFLGKIVADPGWLFYPVALSLKGTPFVLPIALGAMLFLWKHRKHPNFSEHFKIAVAIAVVVILFMMFLSVTSKKFSRYLLPVFPMLNLLAGIGLFYTVKWIGSHIKKQHYRKVAHVVCVTLVLLLTVIPVFALHPYYGTYYNLCWKVTDITKVFTVGGDGSGLDIAAKYLNQKPNARQLKVQVSALGTGFFQHYFLGSTYQFPLKFVKNPPPPPPIDYQVIYIRDSQIDWIPQTGTRNGELEAVVTLNGIECVWIYRVQQEEN